MVMMGWVFSYSFLAMVAVTLGFFAAAELWPARRQLLAGIGAVCEAVVFAMLAVVFYAVRWEGVPSWLMALLPLAGALFALRMAWRRWRGDP